MKIYYILFILPILFFGACASTPGSRNIASDQGVTELVYEVDFEATQKTAGDLSVCGYPTEFRMESDDPIGPTFIAKISPNLTTVTRVQSLKAATSGGPVPNEYQGAYREKVYIIKQKMEGTYKPAIYTRAQITTYGSTDAPSGLVVNTELINHRYSAELAIGDECDDVYYKLSE